jgi:co-chaperonin GroES (HSP10)
MVVIERDPKDEKLSKVADLVAPDEYQKENRAREGTVIAVGPGRWGSISQVTTDVSRDGDELKVQVHAVEEVPIRLPMTLKHGDRVVWGPYTAIGTPAGFLGNDAMGIDFRGKNLEDLILIAEADVLAVIEEEDDG